MTDMTKIGTVLVVGAGITGIKAALEIAEIGYKALLIDASPQVGGILAKLDNQFPTDHCGMCRMLPMVGRDYASQFCMRKSLYHENIEILPFTELKSVSGDIGNFSVELQKKARYVDPDKCNGLGECIDVCPIEVDDEFNHNLTKRKAIYQMVPHNEPKMLIIDREACKDCQDQPCLKACPTDAINLEAQDELETREVDSIILAMGSKLYNLKDSEDANSYAVSPDVVSSLAFERIISGSGTYNGIIKRPSDGKPANRIAWIQCMGSRNRRQGRDFCSSICCMFALKEAVMAKEKGGPETETTIFYMDMRTFGKDYYRYCENAVDNHGVKLVRCRVQEVLHDTDGSLKIRYFDSTTNKFFVETYDMVVLSTGQAQYAEHKKFAQMLDLELDSQKLLPTDDLNKVKLTKPGIFICGSFMGLTDISEAMSSGIAAAGQATKLLLNLSKNTIEEKPALETRLADRELAEISIILCKNNKSQEDNKIDIDLLTSTLLEQKSIKSVDFIDSIFSNEGLAKFQEIATESKGNRLLIGAAKPFLYQTKLQKIAENAGYDPSLIEIFDINIATDKHESINHLSGMISEIRSHIENLRLKPALQFEVLQSNKTALVIGGGIIGMYSALSLAENGATVHIVERADKLGGYAGNEVSATIDGVEPIKIAKDLSKQVSDNNLIKVHLNSEILSSHGLPGNYDTQIKETDAGLNISIDHAVTIFATGNSKSKTSEYQYGQSDKILTHGELGVGLRSGEIDAKDMNDVVMIQCVGSREKETHEYCSRICCMGAIFNALLIKEKNPDTRVFMLYRDIMTYGSFEKYYTEARSKGVIFVEYSLDNKPTVAIEDGKPVVTFKDIILDAEIELSVDMLALATGIEADQSNQKLAEIYGVDLNEDGFFVEADAKWRPIEFQKLGTYVVGVAHSPMTIKESILQADAAVQKSLTYLSGREIRLAREISVTHDANCVRCKRCIDICPYHARSFDIEENCIVIDSATCQACGMCATACRNSAAEVKGWSSKQMMAVIDAKLMNYNLPATSE